MDSWGTHVPALAAAIKHVPGLEVSMKFMQWS